MARRGRAQQLKQIVRGRQKPLVLTIYDADGRPRDLDGETVTLSLFRLRGDAGYDTRWPYLIKDASSADVVVSEATTTLLTQSGDTLGQLSWDPLDDGQEHEHDDGSFNLPPAFYALQVHLTDANGDVTDYPEEEPGTLVIQILPSFRTLAE